MGETMMRFGKVRLRNAIGENSALMRNSLTKEDQDKLSIFRAREHIRHSSIGVWQFPETRLWTSGHRRKTLSKQAFRARRPPPAACTKTFV
ncbi:MAG: hypothetical protein WDN69_28885 [Aliidongia sp.]